MDSRLKAWLRWLEIIKEEIRELVIAKYIYHQIMNIIDSNPRLNKQNNLFYKYLTHTYVSHVVIGIRRQIKSGKKSISIKSLFEAIISTPQVLSRKYYTGMYPPPVSDRADDHFNQLTFPNSDCIDAELVRNDLASLQKASKRLEGFADKHVAHRDQSGLKDPPTFNDVDSCIDLLDKLYGKYHKFFHAEDIDTLLIEPPHDWEKIFYVPWLPSTTKTSTNQS